MKIRCLSCVLATLMVVTTLAAAPQETVSTSSLAFEPNRGQAPSSVRFLSRGNGYGLFLTDTEAVVSLIRPQPVSIHMKLAGQTKNPKIQGLSPREGVSHYLLGEDKQHWQEAVPHFDKVLYQDVYPGIDVVYYGDQRQLEYDFIVSPKATAETIRLDFSGVEDVSLDADGDLVLHTPSGDIRHKHPIAYQDIHGRRTAVDAEFVLTESKQAGFKLGSYNPEFPVVIDPKLAWASYLGGVGNDAGNDLALDSAGNVYVTGYTVSPDFWMVNGQQSAIGGKADAFITKIDPSGALAYSTFIGGSGDDESHSIALDAAGNIYITGFTTSTNFPIVNGFKGTFGGIQDAYVLKLNSSGTTIQYSTYLGGSQSDRAYGIAVDPAGNAFVTGTTSSSTNFPILNAYRAVYGGGLGDVFLSKIRTNGTLEYSTFLGGIGNDLAYDLAVDVEGNVVLTGFTSSVNFPLEKPLYSKFLGGADDAFIAKFNPTGRALIFSTYFGGAASDNAVRLTTDKDNYIYVTGYTSSTDFPLKRPAQLFHRGVFDAFLLKLNPDGQDAAYSTFIGGEDTESGVSIAVGADSSVYLAGFTNSIEFYAINAIGGFLRGARDAFVMKIAPDASNVIYSTYLGGFGIDGATAIALDGAGNAYVTGFTFSADFPLADGAFQAGIFGDQDAFLVKINSDDIKTVSPFDVPARGGANIATAGQTSVTIFGYATVDVDRGLAPSGIEIVDLRSVGTLVNEVAIPATPAISVGRLMGRTVSGDGTAISMANRSSEEVRVDFYFTTEEGVTADFGYFTIPANSHVSALLTDEPFNIPFDKSGTLTFSTSAALYAAALRVDTTSSVPVNTYVPIVDPYTANDRLVTIPEFVDGQGWTTQFFLVNTTESQMEGELRLMKNSGGANASAFSIPATGGARISTEGQATTSRSGYATADLPARVAASGLGITSFRSGGALVSEVSTPTNSPLTTGRLVASTLTGDVTTLTLSNPSSEPIDIAFYFTTEDGVTADFGGLSIPAGGQVSAPVNSVPFGLAAGRIGTMTFSATAPVYASAIRIDSTGVNPVHTELPIVDPYTANSRPVSIPQFLEGAGWSTSYFLINTTDSQMEGELRLFRSDASRGLGVPATVATDQGTAAVFHYSIPPRTVRTIRGTGESTEIITGRAEVVPAAGSNTPASFAVLGLNNDGGVAKTTIQAQEPASEIRGYVERSGQYPESLATEPSVAIANSSGSPAVVTFRLTGLDGVPSRLTGSVTVPAFGLFNGLLREIQGFQNLPSPYQGELRVTTSAPGVSGMIFRRRYNERNQLLMTPTSPLRVSDTASVVFTRVIDGAGYGTELVLLNASQGSGAGSVRYVGSLGTPLYLPIVGQSGDNVGIPAEIATEQGIGSVFSYSIPPRSLRIITGRGESNETTIGHADIVPSAGSSTPSAFAVLTLSDNGGLMKTTVEAQEPAADFRVYVESSGKFLEPLAATPSISIANTSETVAVVRLELSNLQGVPAELSGTVTIPPRGHLNAFLREINGFQDLPSPYQGVLRATTSSPGVTMTGFRARYNERNQFLMLATGPLKDLTGTPFVVYPHLVDGGGYATQFILVNGSAGDASGVLRYLNQSGGPLNLSISN